MGRITIDEERCRGCELCVAACPPRVIVMATRLNGDGLHPAELMNAPGCTGCAVCAWICPHVAIVEVFR